MSTILVMTPYWVWLILLFLVIRGVKAMRPNSLPLTGMLILPVVFSVWAGMSLFKSGHSSLSVDGWLAVGLLVGLGLGMSIFNSLRGYAYDHETKIISRPGTVRMLLISVAAFVSKFALAVYVVQSTLQQTAVSPLIYGGVTGAVCGLLWGAIGMQIFKALKQSKSIALG